MRALEEVVAFVELIICLLTEPEVQVGPVDHGWTIAKLGTLLVQLHRLFVVQFAIAETFFEANG